MMPTRKRILMQRFGKAKGNRSRSLTLPKSFGSLLTGYTKAPPNAGPNIEPIVHTKGMIEKARGCNSFSGTISATTVLMIPTLPFDKPCADLATNAHTKDVEKPKSRLDAIVHVNAMRMTGFRPSLSDARPQAIPVNAWDNEKTADVRPAYFATCSVGTLKDCIISGCRKSVHRARRCSLVPNKSYGSFHSPGKEKHSSLLPVLRSDILQARATAGQAVVLCLFS